MQDAIDEWVEEWFGDGCPAWTWPSGKQGPPGEDSLRQMQIILKDSIAKQ